MCYYIDDDDDDDDGIQRRVRRSDRAEALNASARCLACRTQPSPGSSENAASSLSPSKSTGRMRASTATRYEDRFHSKSAKQQRYNSDRSSWNDDADDDDDYYYYS